MPQKDDEPSYLDVMMENLAKAHEKGGGSFAEATAISAMVKAAWNEVALRTLMDVLERKGILSQAERDGVDQEVLYSMKRLSRAAEVKYPLVAEIIKSEEPR